MSKLNDPLCVGCNNSMMTFIINGENVHRPCPGLCMPMLWINGNKARREPLVEDLRIKPPHSKDYNQTLSEIIEDRQTALDKITDIEDPKRRAIAAMLLVHVSRNEIATLLSMSDRQLYRIIKYHK
jgi:hypothetical protein